MDIEKEKGTSVKSGLGLCFNLFWEVCQVDASGEDFKNIFQIIFLESREISDKSIKIIVKNCSGE